MTDTPLFDAGPTADVCGNTAPNPLYGLTCDRPPGHGGPHFVNGPRNTRGQHVWSADWRDE